MYFKEKEDTNIDKEFSNNEKNKIDFKKIKPLLFIVGGIILLIVILLIVIPMFKNKNTNKIILEGEQNLTIALGSEYYELGYKAYDKKGKDITDKITINSNLDVSKEGSYEILYSVNGISKIRFINTKKDTSETLIYLNKGKEISVEKDKKYEEPGYTVYDTEDNDLTNKVKIIGSVDTTNVGTYEIIYYVTNSSNITTIVKRKVNVIEK